MLRRSVPLARSKRPIRPISKKRRRLLAARRRAVAERLEQCLGVCEAFGLGVSCQGMLQPHEPLTRARGGSITDAENIRMVCAGHHRFIHEHPQLAERMGMLTSSWNAA